MKKISRFMKMSGNFRKDEICDAPLSSADISGINRRKGIYSSGLSMIVMIYVMFVPFLFFFFIRLNGAGVFSVGALLLAASGIAVSSMILKGTVVFPWKVERDLREGKKQIISARVLRNYAVKNDGMRYVVLQAGRYKYKCRLSEATNCGTSEKVLIERLPNSGVVVNVEEMI